MRILIVIIFAISLLSCNNSNDKAAKTDSTTSKINVDTLQNVSADTVLNIYCYITGIDKMHDSVLLRADYVDFFNGPNVLEEAKKRHLADTVFDKNGKVQDIFVPDDYFIVNDDKSIRPLYLPSTAPIMMDSEIAGKKSNSINTFTYFSKHFDNSLFLLKVKKNVVESVKEVFLP